MAKSLDNLQQKQIFVRLLVFSLVTVMVWVFFSLFRSQQSSAIDPELQRLAIPLVPVIDTATLTELEQRRSFTPEELAQFPIYTVFRDETGTEQIRLKTSTGVASRSAQPAATPVAPSVTQTPAASSVSPTPIP